MNSRIRIAHLQLLPILSGVQNVSLDIFRRLDREVFEPYLICQSPGPLSEAAESLGVRCLYAGHLVRSISPRSDAAAFTQLVRLLRRYRFDILHTHSSKTGFLGRPAGRLAGIPIVLHTVHGFAFPAANTLAGKAVFFASEWFGGRCCDGLICLKEDDHTFAQRWLRVPPERLHLIPNGIATKRFQPLDIPTRQRLRRDVFGVTNGRPLIGMVGRLSRQKNPLCFVRAADAVLSGGHKAKFYLIGNGELRDEVDAEIRRRGRTGDIVVLGWRDDIPQLLAALDAFVLTSRWEGLSLAVLEAMACGLPVVASDIPGNRDLVLPEADGLLAPCEDSGAFAGQIGRLVADPDLRDRFGQAGRRKTERCYDIDARVTRVMDLYRTLVIRKRGRLSRRRSTDSAAVGSVALA